MWYVVQTVAGREEHCMKLCEEYIGSELYKEMFIPSYIAKMHFKREWHDVIKTLFPGYFFIDTKEVFGIIERLNRAGQREKFLRNAENIMPIAKEEQRYLTGMMDDGHIIPSSVGLIIGDKICITDGPLKNFYGKIKKIDRHRRIAKLDINLFGRPTPAEVGLEIIAKLSKEEFEKMEREEEFPMYGENMKTQSDGSGGDFIVREMKMDIPENKVSEGDTKVEIMSGVFEGHTGKLVSRSSDGKECAVQLKLFGTPTNVMFSKEELRYQNT